MAARLSYSPFSSLFESPGRNAHVSVDLLFGTIGIQSGRIHYSKRMII